MYIYIYFKQEFIVKSNERNFTCLTLKPLIKTIFGLTSRISHCKTNETNARDASEGATGDLKQLFA